MGEEKKEARAFLQANDTMVIATASAKGEPQAAPVYYAMDDDFTFHFVTASESRKAAHIRENQKVAFTVWGSKGIAVVQGGGNAVMSEGNHDDIIERISRKLDDKPYHWPLLEAPHAGYVGVTVKPEWLVWLSVDGDAKDLRRYYKKII